MTAGTYWQAIDRFRAFARSVPDREAVIYPVGQDHDGLPTYRHLSYRELDEWSDAIAEGLTAAGVGSGTRTIVFLLPGPELYAVMIGLLKIGAMPVVIDPGMGVRKMLRCLRAVDAEAFIGIPQAHALRVLFRRNFRRVRAKVTVGKRWFWGGDTLQEWGTTPVWTAPHRVPAAANDPLLIAFTTGSTGPAKAVEMTHGNLAAMVEQVHAARGNLAPETSLITLPLIGIIDLLLGSRCVLPPLIPSKVGSTDPAHVVDAIERYGVRTMFASPAVLIPLLRYVDDRPNPWSPRSGIPALKSVDSILSGGAPVPDWCITGLRQVLREDAQVLAGYGSTEALPMSTIESRELSDCLIDRTHRGEGTCLGRPADRVQVRVVPITDDPMPTWADVEKLARRPETSHGIGELVVSGPNVSTRYYWPKQATRQHKIIDGDVIWHRTGDVAWIDDRGRIWFCGRKSQRLETLAGPMFTVQVEQVFNTVAGVARTALVGVGERGAQRPVLCVECEPDATPAVVESRLRTRASEFELTKPITDFLFHPEFPVDIRHNAKIGREQLTGWAAKTMGVSR